MYRTSALSFPNGAKVKREDGNSSYSREKEGQDLSNKKRKREVAQESSVISPSASPSPTSSSSKLNTVKDFKDVRSRSNRPAEGRDDEKETSQQVELNHPDFIANGNRGFSKEEIGKNCMNSPRPPIKYPVMMLPNPSLLKLERFDGDEDGEVDVNDYVDDEDERHHDRPVLDSQDDEPSDPSQQYHHGPSSASMLDESGQPTRKLRRSRTTFTTFQLHQLG